MLRVKIDSTRRIHVVRSNERIARDEGSSSDNDRPAATVPIDHHSAALQGTRNVRLRFIIVSKGEIGLISWLSI